MNPTTINISYANLWSRMESLCHTHYKVRAQKSLGNLKWKLNHEKDAPYPQDFFTASVQELRGCSNFLCIPPGLWQCLGLLPQCLHWNSRTGMSRFDFPTIIYIPLNLRGPAGWKDGGGCLRMWVSPETSLSSPWGRQQRELRAELCHQLECLTQSHGPAVVTSGSALGSLGCFGLCWKWWEVTLKLSMEVMFLWLWSLIKISRQGGCGAAACEVVTPGWILHCAYTCVCTQINLQSQGSSSALVQISLAFTFFNENNINCSHLWKGRPGNISECHIGVLNKEDALRAEQSSLWLLSEPWLCSLALWNSILLSLCSLQRARASRAALHIPALPEMCLGTPGVCLFWFSNYVRQQQSPGELCRAGGLDRGEMGDLSSTGHLCTILGMELSLQAP